MRHVKRAVAFRLRRLLGLAVPQRLAAVEMDGESGATLVEMALSMTVLFAVLLGMIQACFAFYVANALNLAAREATRWVAVRGSNSCTVLSTFPYCNYAPTGYAAGNATTYTAGTSNDPVEIFVQGLPFPGLNSATASATWWTATQDTSGATVGATQWTTACTGSVDGNGNPCNSPGHMVKVNLTYSFPLNLPFVGNNTISMHTSSALIINE